MIKTFIHRLLGRSAPAEPVKTPLGRRVEIPADVHGIDATLLDDHAVRVVRSLKDAGHEAYIVGGAVRDLLVGRRPKDFDVATDATPEQVKSLFRRAFIIGRRFRIVHVVFGRGREHEVIEVSTFRALLGAEEAQTVAGNEKTSKSELAGKTHVVDASGRVLRDNVWGPQVEDAARRDFTVNALYYEPLSRIVVDYHHGFEDVRGRVLRMIGDPATRYREDPVRLLRVVRFAAKLGFTIEARTRKAMAGMAALLANVPGSRLFDEMVKLLQTGHAVASLEQLKAHGLIQGVFPVLEAALDGAERDETRERFIRLALEDTDQRVAEGRSVAPSFLLACLLWHDVQKRWAVLRDAGEAPFPALSAAIDEVFNARVGDISGRGKLAADMREIWQMQPRFERRTVASVSSLVEQPRFRAGYDFLRLRSDVGEIPAELAEWWDDFYLGSPEEREAMVADLKASQTRRIPGKKGSAGVSGSRSAEGGRTFTLSRANTDTDSDTDAAMTESSPDAGEGAEDASATSADAPARKRRRRRRRGGSAGAGGEGGSEGAGSAELA